MRVSEFVERLVVALAGAVEIVRREQDSGFVFASRGDRSVAVDVFVDADATTVNVVRGLDFEPVEHVMGRTASAALAEEIAAMLRPEYDATPRSQE
jgi:hypothetical protein